MLKVFTLYGEADLKLTRSRSNTLAYAHDVEVSGALRAARAIAPVVCELIGTPMSVVDLGGGTGAWCMAFKECGAQRVYCIDHPAARTSELLIDEDEFQAADLSYDAIAPIRADLAICVEVAEHLPSSRADWIVGFLTESAPVVLFSAAIPRQGGAYHINEQPPWYWSQRFAARGYEQRDCLRGRILFDKSIPYWYRQNIMIYADPARIPPFVSPPLLPEEFELIHQDIVERLLGPPTLRTAVREFVPAIARAINHRLSRR